MGRGGGANQGFIQDFLPGGGSSSPYTFSHSFSHISHNIIILLNGKILGGRKVSQGLNIYIYIFSPVYKSSHVF